MAKTVVEVTIPRCDTAIMDYITFKTGSTFEKVLEAAIVRGLFVLSNELPTITDQSIQEWCEHTWDVIGESLLEVP